MLEHAACFMRNIFYFKLFSQPSLSLKFPFRGILPRLRKPPGEITLTVLFKFGVQLVRPPFNEGGERSSHLQSNGKTWR